MLFYALVVMCVFLTAIAYLTKRTMLAISAAFSWLLFALECYTLSTAMFDMYYGAFIFGIGMMLAITVESIYMKISAVDLNESKEDREERIEKRKPQPQVKSHPSNRMDKIREKHGMRRKEKQERHTRSDNW